MATSFSILAVSVMITVFAFGLPRSPWTNRSSFVPVKSSAAQVGAAKAIKTLIVMDDVFIAFPFVLRE